MPATVPTPAQNDAASVPADDDPISIVKPPWTLTGDFYIFCHWITGSEAAKMPSAAHSPLEAASQFGDPLCSRPVGGIGMVQIIRYHQSPVGPYDELAIIPGKFEWSRDTPDGGRVSSQDYKISRIFVSQKHTCYNGRANWNIPKHLARFDWEEHPNKSVTVRVYPRDRTPNESLETSPTPFFEATVKSLGFLPAFPFSTSWMRYVGVNTRFVLPPLPSGDDSQEELPGTDRWCAISPVIHGNNSTFVSVCAPERSKTGDDQTDFSNSWPWLEKLRFGVKMSNATMTIGPPDETW